MNIPYHVTRAKTFLKTGYWLTGERVCPAWQDANFINHLKVYKFLAQFVHGKDVLEVGCGTGYGTRFLADHARRVVAIDYSKEALRYAIRHYSHPNITYLQKDADVLDIMGQYDLIFSTEVFEHLHNPRHHLERVRLLLAPDGLCFIATPNPELTNYANEFHTKEWAFGELRAVMREYFDAVEIIETMNKPPTAAQAASRDARFRAGEKGIDPTSSFSIFGIPVDRTHLSNTHSFFVFAR